jgi:hypothetical protein
MFELPFYLNPPVEYSQWLEQEVATDESGNIYVATYGVILTDEVDLSRNSIIVRKLTPDLSVVYETFVTGNAYQTPTGLAIDEAGNAYVAGGTYSTDLPATAGALQRGPGGAADGFVLKLDPEGRVVYLTYLGGRGPDFVDDLAVDPQGYAAVIGRTASADFPVRNAQDPSLENLDVFVAKLTPDGSSLIFSTYLGGSGWETGSGIGMTRSGHLFVAGTTGSADFPLVDPIPRPCASESARLCGSDDTFVSELSPDGALVFSTLLGGSSFDYGHDLALGPEYEAAVLGATTSADLPLVNPIQYRHSGEMDLFIVRLTVNRPPDCSATVASPGVIWPPNGRFVPIQIAGMSDPEERPVTLQITAITQDEPVSGSGQDAAGIGTPTAWVRADRQSGGDGRVYRIDFEGRDELGAVCTGAVTVCVPHDRRPGAECR